MLKPIPLLLELEEQVKVPPQVVTMVLIQFFLQLHPQGEEAEVFLHLRVEVIRVDQEVEVLENLALLRAVQEILLLLVPLKEIMVETEEDFSYFRNNCPSQYATLEEMKTECPSEETPGACKENVTKFQTKALGPKLWMNNNDTQTFTDNSYIINLVLRAAPLPMPVKVVLAASIMARKAEVKAKNKGCGVVLHWTWINFPSITFWVTAQK